MGILDKAKKAMAGIVLGVASTGVSANSINEQNDIQTGVDTDNIEMPSASALSYEERMSLLNELPSSSLITDLPPFDNQKSQNIEIAEKIVKTTPYKEMSTVAKGIEDELSELGLSENPPKIESIEVADMSDKEEGETIYLSDDYTYDR